MAFRLRSFHSAVAVLFSAALCVAQTPATPAAGPAMVPGAQNQAAAPVASTPAQAPPATTAPAQTTPAAPSGPPVTVPGALNLTNASLTEVIDILARDLHINYILDPKVKGSVTINTYGEIRAVDMRNLLETILRMNNFSMVQVGNIYRIVPAVDTARLPITPQANSKDLPDDERMVLNLVFLKYVTSAEMAKLLEPFIGEGSKMIAYDPANLLIIQDNARNMKRTVDLINMFDSQTLAGQRVQTYSLNNARASDMAKDLDRIFKAYAFSDKTSAVRFLPLDRIGTLVALAPNAGTFEEVDRWVKKLDVPVKLAAGGTGNHVYRLKYGRAEIIGNVIGQLYGLPVSQFGGGVGGAYPQGFGAAFRNSGVGTGVNGGFGGGGLGGGYNNTFGNNGYGNNGFNNPYGNGGGYGNAGGGVYGASAGVNATAAPAVSPFATSAAGTSGAAATGTATGTTDQTGTFLGANPQTPQAGAPRIVPNPIDNTLLVQSTADQWEQISGLLNELDVAPRQVLIEAKIFEVDLTGDFAAGVEAYLQRKSGANRQLTGSSNFNFNPGLVLTAGTLVGHSRELLSMVTAQESNGRTKVISAPSVIATDSIPASITVGDDVPTLTGQAVDPGITSGGTSQFTQSINSRSTGVSLNVLARVNASGVVTMVIDQSVSAPQANKFSTIQSPAFSHRDVSTQVTVEDGDTIAIGGIISENYTVGTSGIPYLSRIPGLGTIFGNRSTHKDRTELIVFLTPKVIYDTTQVAEATEEIKTKLKGLTKIMKDK